MTCPVVVRPATRADAAEISAVVVTALRISNAIDYAPDIIARIVGRFGPAEVAAMIGTRCVLVASEEGRILGTAALDGAAVRSVFVLPGAQGRGVGSALVAEIVARARSAGIGRLRLQSSLGARGFYERRAFHAVGESTYGDERTIVMECDLAAPPSAEGPS